MVKYASGKSDGEQPKKEEARRQIAVSLLKYSSVIFGIALVGVLVLIGIGKLDPDKAVTFLLVVASVFSGLLGSAITYYFTSK